MLLDKKIEITIFKVDNTTFEALGHLDEYTSLMWPDAFIGRAMFQLWAPLTENNAELLKEGNIVWCGGDNAAIIQIIKTDINENGEKEYHVKGWTLESLLYDRIVWGTFSSGVAYSSTVMYELVNRNAINPSNPARKIPYLENDEDTHVGIRMESFQKTGGWLYDVLYNVSQNGDIGFSILFDPRRQKLIFQVKAGVDRTQEQTANEPVVFSTELEDILSSSYYLNTEDVRNVAFVQGEAKEDKSRTSVITGNNNLTGFKRRELYVDARDLQSEVYDEDMNPHILTPTEYLATLTQRGNEKLSEHVKTETFEAQIRQFGNVQYEFGKDYFKGDKITVIDEQLGISVSARITNVEEDFNEEYKLVLTFGYSYPTLLQKVKRATNY